MVFFFSFKNNNLFVCSKKLCYLSMNNKITFLGIVSLFKKCELQHALILMLFLIIGQYSIIEHAFSLNECLFDVSYVLEKHIDCCTSYDLFLGSKAHKPLF